MTQKNKRRRYTKKRYILPATIIIFLLLLRLVLPLIVKKYVNGVLADIPGYYGHVENIDIALIRGAYSIHNLYLNRINAEAEVPFLDFEQTDIAVEWKSLFDGRIVSEVIMVRPTLIYVFEDQQDTIASEPGVEDWSKALTDLVPIDINHLEIINGKVAFVQLQANPNIDLHLTKIQLNATNLRNVVQKELVLPSQLHATAVSIGDGAMKLDGKMNLIKKIPDLDIEFSLEKADVRALNDFTRHYAEIDFESGTFEVFGEVAIADGFLTGSIKPIIQNAKLLGKEDKFLETLWEGFVGLFKFILKNQKKDTLATKVPIEGDLNNVGAKIWPTITNIFQNAWIKAFQNIVDDDIDFKDAQEGADSTDSGEAKKDARQKRRAERKKE